MRPRLILLTLLAAAAVFGGQASNPGLIKPEPMIERLRSMTPEQRERFLNRLPPERRAKVEKRLQEYEQLSPEQRERLQESYSAFRRLPPEKQDEVRLTFKQFNQLPQPRKVQIRRELAYLQTLSPEARQGRLDSPAVRDRFSPEEQQILGRMTSLLNPSLR
jgi:hypothetical protein